MQIQTSLQTKVIDGYGLALDATIKTADQYIKEQKAPLTSKLYLYRDLLKLIDGLDTNAAELTYLKYSKTDIQNLRKMFADLINSPKITTLLQSPVNIYLPANIETSYIYYPAVSPIGDQSTQAHFNDETEANRKLCQDIANLINLLEYVAENHVVPDTLSTYNQFDNDLMNLVLAIVTKNANSIADLDLAY